MLDTTQPTEPGAPACVAAAGSNPTRYRPLAEDCGKVRRPHLEQLAVENHAAASIARGRSQRAAAKLLCATASGDQRLLTLIKTFI